MLKHVTWNQDDIIVELWWWSGVMTRAILEKKHDGSTLTCCEIEKDRYEWLKQYHNSHTKIVHMDAQACLESFQDESIDIIVSTLPLWSMNPVHAREIIEAISKWIKKDGLFLQYQYFATNKEDIEKYFTIVKTDWEPINFPPAFIYICKKR
jgi:phospholipid N-methyltransferase